MFSANRLEINKAKYCFSMGYVSVHMNPKNKLGPLFEAQLELLDPDMVFAPSLDPNDEKGFTALVKSIIDDILKMSTLVDRIDTRIDKTYEQYVVNSEDVIEMKNEIIAGIEKVIEDANDFCKTFENYSYLWLEERDAVMEIFLTYGRILSPDEVDKIGSEDKDVIPPTPCAPKMEGFREQIDQFENLFMDIEDMDSHKIFNCWFQVNLKNLR